MHFLNPKAFTVSNQATVQVKLGSRPPPAKSGLACDKQWIGLLTCWIFESNSNFKARRSSGQSFLTHWKLVTPTHLAHERTLMCISSICSRCTSNLMLLLELGSLDVLP